MGKKNENNSGSLVLAAPPSREQAMVLALRSLDLGKDTLEEQNFTAAQREQIARLKELRATFGSPGEPYAQVPGLSAPYGPGGLTDAFLQDGLNAINYIRAVAGLEPVAMTEEKNRAAQAGALLLAAGTFGHFPGQPDGMADDLYRLGYSATSTGNIGAGYSSLSQFNLSCADDSDDSNIARLGHRRWLLDPSLTTVGMGYVSGRAVTKVTDGIYTGWTGPDYLAWPSEGVFPMELFNQNLAWSCSLSPDVYVFNREGQTVTVTDGSGHTWTGQASGRVDLTAGFVLLEGTAYGGVPAVIFRPAGLKYRAGAPLTVTISGLQLKSGGTGTITYTVKLF